MLVLSRKEGETIEIPSLGIVIQVSAVKKSRAVLGIEAPGDVQIVRGEVMDRDLDAHQGHLSQRSSEQLLIELEAEIAALTEMCSEEHRSVANQTALQTLQALRNLRRRWQQQHSGDNEARPLSDFVAVRSEVLEHLINSRAKTSEPDILVTPPDRVRQSSVGYVIGGEGAVCQVA
ncbi:carbon storage regulator [Rubripirellula amarantea]|nr:carbon storage regulator [Rubripirellula amarantea]